MIQLWVVRACLLPAVGYLSAAAPAPGARTTADWIMIRWWVMRACLLPAVGYLSATAPAPRCPHHC